MSSVGQKLKDARIAKGLTLDDLQQSTKIQKRYLIAIEEDNYSALPGDFYVRAFARQYAETVGLDPDEIVNEIDQELGTPSSNTTDESQLASRSQKREQLNHPEENTPGNKLAKYLPTIIIVVIVIAILGTIYAVAWGNHEKAKNQQIEQTSEKVAVSTDVKKSTSSKKEKSSAKSSKESQQKINSVGVSGSMFTYNVENAPKDNKIELAATSGSSWDSVTIDGAQNWQGTLQQGANHEIKVPENTQKVIISIGNSNASEVKINGQKLNFLEQNSSLTVRKLVITFGDQSSSNTQQTQGQTTNTTNATTTGDAGQNVQTTGNGTTSY